MCYFINLIRKWTSIPTARVSEQERMSENYYYLTQTTQNDIDRAEHSFIALLFHFTTCVVWSGSKCSLEEELVTRTVDFNDEVGKTTRSIHHTLTNGVICLRYVRIRESLPRYNTYKQKLKIAPPKSVVRKFRMEFRVWSDKLLTWIDRWLG